MGQIGREKGARYFLTGLLASEFRQVSSRFILGGGVNSGAEVLGQIGWSNVTK